MARKVSWFKWWGRKYLSNRECNRLSLAAHGAYIIISSILWTEVETPGRYTIRGRNGTLEELAEDVLDHARGSKYLGLEKAKLLLSNLIGAGLLEQAPDGQISCMHILEELQDHRLASFYGKQGGNPVLKDSLKAPHKPEEKRKEEKRKDEASSAAALPKARAAAAGMRHISELINLEKPKDENE